MSVKIIEPKFLMLNGKNAFPGVSYEDFLIDILNASRFFREKCPLTEHYKLITEQSNGENDAYCSTYQLDFKLLVDTNIMRERYKNMPEVDYTQMSKGFIFSKTKESVSDIPTNRILNDILECKVEDLRENRYINDTIKKLIKNLKKPKNLFIYYAYEYMGVSKAMMYNFEDSMTQIFENILIYRDELELEKDTYLCFKINEYFVILEWVDRRLIIRDIIDEMLCTNYRDAKRYAIY